MKASLPALILLFLISCQSKNPEDFSVGTNLSIRELEISDTLQKQDSILNLNKATSFSLSGFEIDDYYEYFFGDSLANLQKNTPEIAFKNGTFVLNTIDYKSGFISVRTQNTPLDWDGDSETEYGYEITYWIQSDSSRIVAFCKTKYTWVDEKSDLSFYLHDENGIKPFNPLKRQWNFNDFVDKDVSAEFSQELIHNPPVYVILPKEGKEILIHLALYEYFEPVEVFETFEKLELKQNSLKLNPLLGEFEKIKAW